MSLPDESDFAQRRQQLSNEIARQRGELSNAFRKFELPLQYTETGLRGFTFLRHNAWIFTAVPAVLTVLRFFTGGRIDKKDKKDFVQYQRAHAHELEEKRRKQHPAITLFGYGVKGFRLYRRIKSFLP